MGFTYRSSENGKFSFAVGRLPKVLVALDDRPEKEMEHDLGFPYNKAPIERDFVGGIEFA